MHGDEKGCVYEYEDDVSYVCMYVFMYMCVNMFLCMYGMDQDSKSMVKMMRETI